MFSHAWETFLFQSIICDQEVALQGIRYCFLVLGLFPQSGAVRINYDWPDVTAVWGFWGLPWPLRSRPTNLQQAPLFPTHPPTSWAGRCCRMLLLFGGFVFKEAYSSPRFPFHVPFLCVFTFPKSVVGRCRRLRFSWSSYELWAVAMEIQETPDNYAFFSESSGQTKPK